MDNTFVSSIAKITAPFAKRANLPVSSVIFRDPTSNSSVCVSRIFFTATGVSELATADVHNALALRPPQIVRSLIRRQGLVESRGLALPAIGAIGRQERWRRWGLGFKKLCGESRAGSGASRWNLFGDTN